MHTSPPTHQDGSGYVVTSVVVQFKLRSGKYVRDHNRYRGGEEWMNVWIRSPIGRVGSASAIIECRSAFRPSSVNPVGDPMGVWSMNPHSTPHRCTQIGGPTDWSMDPQPGSRGAVQGHIPWTHRAAGLICRDVSFFKCV